MPKALVRLLCLAICFGLLLLSPVPALAKKLAPISGKLSKPGYTLIALADSGKPTVVVVKKAKFKLRPPAKEVTLQLRGPDGVYAGPIVVGQAKKGKRVIVGIRAGAKLGKVIVKGGKGYAKLKKKLAEKWIDTKRTATAKKGVPLGNGRNAGFVRSKPPRHPPPGDRDADGVPDVLDVDINGNRIFNNIDGATPGRGAHAAQAGSEVFGAGLVLFTRIEDTVNADAGSTAAQIAAALPAHLWIGLQIAPGDSVELDCGGSPDLSSPTGWSGGLSWCTKGGTGWVPEGVGGPFPGQPFPDCCDPDGDGYGTMINNSGGPIGGPNMILFPNATADQIGTGDTLIERVTTGGVEHQLVDTLQYSVATVPALVSYDDGQGDAATVSYPVSAGGPNPGPGTEQNPFPVKADPSTGHVTVMVTLWRPQRKPIPSDANGAGGDACLSDNPPCQWIDIGGLNYEVQIGPPDTGAECPQSAFLSHGSNLADGTDLPGTPGLRDLGADQPASALNKLTFTLDLTECAASPVYGDGSPAPPRSFQPGDTPHLTFQYSSASPLGSSVQGGQEIFFTRVP